MHKITRPNEELAPVKGGITGVPVVDRHKYTLLRTRLTLMLDFDTLKMISADDRILPVAVMPFFNRLVGRKDGHEAKKYEQYVAAMLDKKTIWVLLPSKQDIEAAKAALGDYGATFAPNYPIIHSYDGRILAQNQQPPLSGESAKAVQHLLFGDSLKLFEGNDAAIAVLRSELVKKEGVFVFGIGPDSGPVALAMESIRKIRDETTVPVQTGVDKNSGKPTFVQVQKRAFVTFNPLVAKNITEL